jgi:hypothetical protein
VAESATRTGPFLLAAGLINGGLHAIDNNDLQTRDELLDSLRALAAAFPTNGSAREALATALFNTLNQASQEGDLLRRDQLLDELRVLATASLADDLPRSPKNSSSASPSPSEPSHPRPEFTPLASSSSPPSHRRSKCRPSPGSLGVSGDEIEEIGVGEVAGEGDAFANEAQKLGGCLLVFEVHQGQVEDL